MNLKTRCHSHNRCLFIVLDLPLFGDGSETPNNVKMYLSLPKQRAKVRLKTLESFKRYGGRG